MRRWLPGLLIAGVLATGCKDHYFQVSVHPFFSATEAPGDVGGRWASEGDDAIGLVFVPASENEWRVDFFDPNAREERGEDAVLGAVHFGRVGAALYWDMTAQNAGSAAPWRFPGAVPSASPGWTSRAANEGSGES